jgi:hypothetical protein
MPGRSGQEVPVFASRQLLTETPIRCSALPAVVSENAFRRLAAGRIIPTLNCRLLRSETMLDREIRLCLSAQGE